MYTYLRFCPLRTSNGPGLRAEVSHGGFTGFSLDTRTCETTLGHVETTQTKSKNIGQPIQIYYQREHEFSMNEL